VKIQVSNQRILTFVKFVTNINLFVLILVYILVLLRVELDREFEKYLL
jgi:hypothetical protein